MDRNRNLRMTLPFLFITVLMVNMGMIQYVRAEAPAEKSTGKEQLIDAITGSGAVQEKKLDQAGEKVGRKIEGFAQAASKRVGNWINAKVIFGITWLKLIVSVLILFAAMVLERLVRLVIEHRRKKAEPDKGLWSSWEHLVFSLGGPLSLTIYVYGCYGALTPLFTHFQQKDGTNIVHATAQKGVDLFIAVALIWFVIKLVGIVDVKLKKWVASTGSTIDDILAPLVSKTLRIFIVIIGTIAIIQNLTGVEIGPLLASLGIGGIAVALAARDSIANFFGTITILFDKPFQVGDRIVLDNYDGVVEDVGFRSTRIRLLSGHLVTIPNEKVVNSGLENIGKRPHIRWLTNITITYDTPPEKVEKAVALLQQILENHEGMHPDFPPRVYFNGFNEWSLNILVIAWYHPPDYWDMQAWLQRTCMEILHRFNEEKIDFAFPSSTVYLANDDNRQVKLQMLKGTVNSPDPSPS